MRMTNILSACCFAHGEGPAAISVNAANGRAMDLLRPREEHRGSTFCVVGLVTARREVEADESAKRALGDLALNNTSIAQSLGMGYYVLGRVLNSHVLSGGAGGGDAGGDHSSWFQFGGKSPIKSELQQYGWVYCIPAGTMVDNAGKIVPGGTGTDAAADPGAAAGGAPPGTGGVPVGVLQNPLHRFETHPARISLYEKLVTTTLRSLGPGAEAAKTKPYLADAGHATMEVRWDGNGVGLSCIGPRFQAVGFKSVFRQSVSSQCHSLGSAQSPCHSVSIVPCTVHVTMSSSCQRHSHVGCTEEEVSCRMHSVISGHAHSLDRIIHENKSESLVRCFPTKTGPLFV